jgi:general secretion pathway protein G
MKIPCQRAGFTLIELMVTIVIVAILMGIVLGVSGVANRKSAESRTRADMQHISNALEEYRVTYGSLPADLKVLTNDATKIDKQYKEIKVNDSWGRPYLYTPQAGSRYAYELKSHGAKDGAANTHDDIISGTY